MRHTKPDRTPAPPSASNGSRACSHGDDSSRHDRRTGRRRLESALSGLVALASAVWMAPPATATDIRAVIVTNKAGAAASDLHVTFSGTGGSVSVVAGSVAAPAGCPAPTIGGSGNTVEFAWGMACVSAGATVTFRAETPHGSLAFSGGNWTGAGGGVLGPIGPGDIRLATVRVRKNYQTLSAEERERFRNALKAMKDDTSDTGMFRACKWKNRYDKFVCWHGECGCTGDSKQHGRPMILPWHREMLARFEEEMTSIGHPVSIPYWVWTERFPRHLDDSAADNDFMGATQTEAMPGYFFDPANWTISTGRELKRDNARSVMGEVDGLGVGRAVEAALERGEYNGPDPKQPDPIMKWFHKGIDLGFRPHVEAAHDMMHTWVGGSLADFETAADDPVFWLSHAYLDFLWAQWQATHPAPPTGRYRPDVGKFPQDGMVEDDIAKPMQPWNLLAPGDVLDIASLGYSYEVARPDPAIDGVDARKLKIKDNADARKQKIEYVVDDAGVEPGDGYGGAPRTGASVHVFSRATNSEACLTIPSSRCSVSGDRLKCRSEDGSRKLSIKPERIDLEIKGNTGFELDALANQLPVAIVVRAGGAAYCSVCGNGTGDNGLDGREISVGSCEAVSCPMEPNGCDLP